MELFFVLFSSLVNVFFKSFSWELVKKFGQFGVFRNLICFNNIFHKQMFEERERERENERERERKEVRKKK